MQVESEKSRLAVAPNGKDTSQQNPDKNNPKLNNSLATKCGGCHYKRWILLIVVLISHFVTGLATYYLKVFPIN